MAGSKFGRHSTRIQPHPKVCISKKRPTEPPVYPTRPTATIVLNNQGMPGPELCEVIDTRDVAPQPNSDTYIYQVTDGNGHICTVTISIPDAPMMATCQMHWTDVFIGTANTISEAQGWNGTFPQTEMGSTWVPNWRSGSWQWSFTSP